MNIAWIRNVQAEFIRLYGPRRGPKICGAVIPGVMADFRKVLAGAEPGVPIGETYRADDRRTVVRLEGRRLPGGGAELTRLTVNDIPVDLGGPLPL